MRGGDEHAASGPVHASANTAKARDLVTPQGDAFFEGMIDPARLSFFDLLAVRLVKSPVGDRRDWDLIANWAAGLAPRLTGAST